MAGYCRGMEQKSVEEEFSKKGSEGGEEVEDESQQS